jgi:glycosyltransferase involved in cell wall biosynthesis
MDKILFVADVPINNPASGSEQVINSQALGLCEEGLEVFAVTRQNKKNGSIRSRNVIGIKEFCYFADPENVVSFIFSLVKNPTKIFSKLAEIGLFNIAICHQPFTFFALLARGKLINTQFIYVFHSPSHEEYLLSQRDENFIKRCVQVLARMLIERYCLKRSQKIIVLSEYMRGKLIKIHKVDPRKIAVNPGGTDLKRFFPPANRTDLIKELKLSSDKLNLLTVRNLEHRMGIDNLLKAVALLKQKGTEIHLVIGGEGPEATALDEMVNQKGIKENVTMVGFIPDAKLPKYYGAADFFILPTRNLEGFGLVTVESLACGTPVLGTPVGGTTEILSNIHPNLIFSDITPEAIVDGIVNAFREFFADQNKYYRFRRHCREHAEANYSWQRHIAELTSLIDEISRTSKLAN